MLSVRCLVLISSIVITTIHRVSESLLGFQHSAQSGPPRLRARLFREGRSKGPWKVYLKVAQPGDNIINVV